MTAGAAGPLGLVEEADAAAEYDFAGFTSFQLIRGRVAVEDGYAGTGTAIRAGRVCFSLSHDSVLTPVMTAAAMPRGRWTADALASICTPPCKLSFNSAAIKNPAQHLLKRVTELRPILASIYKAPCKLSANPRGVLFIGGV